MSSAQTQLLVVDDDLITRQLLSDALAQAGYYVTAAASGEEALTLLARVRFDVVLSDIWMHEASGIDVLRAARQMLDPPEVILLTGNSTIDTAIEALRGGAFNYVMKPYNQAELFEVVAAAAHRRHEQRQRVAALQQIASDLESMLSTQVGAPRPRDAQPTTTLVVGELTLNRLRNAATFANQPIHLTRIEFALLACLAEARGGVVTWSELAAHTYDIHLDPQHANNLLRVHIRNVRRKIDPGYIVTVRGIGFRLVNPASASAMDSS